MLHINVILVYSHSSSLILRLRGPDVPLYYLTITQTLNLSLFPLPSSPLNTPVNSFQWASALGQWFYWGQSTAVGLVMYIPQCDVCLCFRWNSALQSLRYIIAQCLRYGFKYSRSKMLTFRLTNNSWNEGEKKQTWHKLGIPKVHVENAWICKWTNRTLSSFFSDTGKG